MNKTPVQENSGYNRNYDELRIIQGSSGREIQGIYAKGVQRLQGRCTFNNKSKSDKRFGHVDEIASLFAYCASPSAGYLTGVDILCDGGLIASGINPLKKINNMQA